MGQRSINYRGHVDSGLSRENVRKEMNSLRNNIEKETSSLLEEDNDVILCDVVPCAPKQTGPNPSSLANNNYRRLSGLSSIPTQNKYGPDDLDLLPREEMCESELFCAVCPFTTMSRYNMCRHLMQHKDSKVTGNPVPTKTPSNIIVSSERGRNFNATTNHANSSAVESTSTHVLSEAHSRALPGKIEPNILYQCQCHTVCGTEELLINHIATLHNSNEYSCPHCSGTPYERTMNLSSIGAHLKLHMDSLYQCCYCKFLDSNKVAVEKHAYDYHHQLKISVMTVREAPANIELVYQCLFCTFYSEKPNKTEINKHLKTYHEIDSKNDKYFCQLCDYQYRCKIINEMTKHTAEKHGNAKPLYTTPSSRVPLNTRTLAPVADTLNSWQNYPAMIRNIPIDTSPPLPLTWKNTHKRPGDASTAVPYKISRPNDFARNWTWDCPHCSAKPISSLACMDHIQCQHLNMAHFKCDACGLNFSSSDLAKRHITESHPNSTLQPKPITENECFIVSDEFWAACYGDYKNKKQFIIQNFSVNTKKCSKCNLYIKMERFNRHTKSHHKISLFSDCQLCRQWFSSKDEADKEVHRNFHKWNIPLVHFEQLIDFAFKFQCNACEQTFTNDLIVKEHCRVKHDYVGTDSFFVPIATKYECGYCKMSVIGANNMLVHWKKMHERDNLEMIYKIFCTIQFNTGPYACYHCNFRSSSYYECKRHHASCNRSNAECIPCGCVLLVQGERLDQKYNLADFFTERPESVNQQLQLSRCPRPRKQQLIPSHDIDSDEFTSTDFSYLDANCIRMLNNN